jgi:hypothetical protein
MIPFNSEHYGLSLFPFSRKDFRGFSRQAEVKNNKYYGILSALGFVFRSQNGNGLNALPLIFRVLWKHRVGSLQQFLL